MRFETLTSMPAERSTVAIAARARRATTAARDVGLQPAPSGAPRSASRPARPDRGAEPDRSCATCWDRRGDARGGPGSTARSAAGPAARACRPPSPLNTTASGPVWRPPVDRCRPGASSEAGRTARSRSVYAARCPSSVPCSRNVSHLRALVCERARPGSRVKSCSARRARGPGAAPVASRKQVALGRRPHAVGQVAC